MNMHHSIFLPSKELVFLQSLAVDISLAALLGDNVYNFGELLLHPIVRSLPFVFSFLKLTGTLAL